jgi:SAM-dependent methyltransferase
MWSNAVEERANDDSSQDEFSQEEPPQEETETDVSKKSSPDIDFNIESERKIANARLCDVLRKLFGANCRVGITPECKDHLMKAREPKLLEMSMSLRSTPSPGLRLIVAPSLAAYADDYPHGKFYVVCVAPLNESLDDKRDLPLEQVYGGLASFAALDFPDNFFDVIVTGSLQFILTKDEWPLVLAECYRVLKPGFPLKSFISNLSGWIDLLTSETTFQNAGPFTSLYSSIVTASLESKSMYPHPAAVVPTILHRTGFHAITRTHLSLPIFWRDSRENRTRIRNARTGEDVYMTMSEIGDRVSTLMYGFWEEIYGEFNDDLEDFGERNRVRKSEAEEFRTMCVISKIGGRKRGRISGE